MSRTFSLVVSALAALLLCRCAEERPPIDRVQTLALDKSFFVGADIADSSDNPEFWAQASLVDLSFGETRDSLFTSSYAQPLTRIKWFITEDLLLARLAYERIEGSDGKGLGEATDEGTVVAAFRIEKHFDIVNDYNSTTGEEVNVLLENDTDRPWYERKYMRVDFSKNINVDSYDFDTLSMIGIYDGVEYEPLSYFVDDPRDPDAPQFDLDEGYFDITLKVFARPLTIDLSDLGWGIAEFPACWFENDFLSGSWPEGGCSPTELTIRHAFRRVVDLDFEPVEWDGERFQAYGAFYIERYGYNRNYGMSDAQWHRFLTHYQIWERSHYYTSPETMEGFVSCYTDETTPFGADPHRDEDGNGTEDECEVVGRGSRCDTFRQRCTLPFRDRTPIVLPWYYADGSDMSVFGSTELSTHQWDVAMRHAIQAARYAECMRVGDEDCETNHPVLRGQGTDQSDAMALALEVDDCRNGREYPELDGDPDECKALADQRGLAMGASGGAIALARMEETLVLCHSPVVAEDPPACGPRRLPEGATEESCDAARAALDAGTEDDVVTALVAACDGALHVRRGDLRYHQVNVIKEPQSSSPWGIYVDSEDPLSGMKVAASINVWSTVTDMWAQKIVDQVRYARGELTTVDITEGTYVDSWAAAVEASSKGGVFPRLSKSEVSSRLSQFALGKKVDLPGLKKAFSDKYPGAMKKAYKLVQQFRGVRSWSKAASTWAPRYNARRNAAKGGQMEASLMNKMMQQLGGVEGLYPGEAIMDIASPVRGMNASVRRAMRQMRKNALAERGACILEANQTPADLASLADVLEEKFGKMNPSDSPQVQSERAEKMRAYLARRVHHGAIVHEMGHSIGMRHNFVGSADAWNYRPQYWQLRTKNGLVSETCDDLSETGEECVGPRYYDPLTQNERENLIHMFMHSSVMEYPGETTQDFMDLGPYDFAAASMFYGDSVAVYASEEFNVGTDRANTVLDKADDFGGILGITHFYGDEELHYSRLQEYFQLIQACQKIDVEAFKPARYDPGEDGEWHPVLDGRLVAVDGEYSRCRAQPVDYVNWGQLRAPEKSEYSGWNLAVHTIDPLGRTRVPYGFATDSWSDLGNVSVYTHDNGADAYEIFNFMVTEQEVLHIFNNYRRGRQEFSVRAAEERALWRYNEKLRDGVKGLALMRNVYRDYSLEEGFDPDGFWASIAPDWFGNNIIASALVFDHFTRMAARPEAGPHHRRAGDPVLRSSVDALGEVAETVMVVPNGVTGKFGNVSASGRPIENRYMEGLGEYSLERIANAGAYYDKINSAMLLTESVDNFISDTRQDFVDARYRAVSMADLFPDGYRRFLGNLLTGDEYLKGPRVAAGEGEVPLLDNNGYPAQGIGWTSWWGETPTTCFPASGTTTCRVYGQLDETFPETGPEQVAPLDGQLGWEEQKFYIAWTLLYLPENDQQNWVDLLRIWELGKDADPGLANRIELHAPSGKVYVARTYGKEEIFGRPVQKGIAARILEYANSLLTQAYETEEGPDLDGDGAADWYLPVFSPVTGEPVVLWDPGLAGVDGEWVYDDGIEGCDADDNSLCKCSNNRACMALQQYLAVPYFMRQAMDEYGMLDPEPDGIW